jgi:hypothetical protein
MENISLACHKNRQKYLFRIRRIHSTLLRSVTVTIQFILISYSHELYLFMKTISLPCSQKPTKKRPSSNQPNQFTLLQAVPLLKLVCHEELFLRTL